VPLLVLPSHLKCTGMRTHRPAKCGNYVQHGRHSNCKFNLAGCQPSECRNTLTSWACRLARSFDIHIPPGIRMTETLSSGLHNRCQGNSGDVLPPMTANVVRPVPAIAPTLSIQVGISITLGHLTAYRGPVPTVCFGQSSRGQAGPNSATFSYIDRSQDNSLRQSSERHSPARITTRHKSKDKITNFLRYNSISRQIVVGTAGYFPFPGGTPERPGWSVNTADPALE
jgi:hypothetical protein